MLSFAVYQDGKLAKNIDLNGAYVVGTDDVPLRADLSFNGGVVECTKRAAGPAGLALLWDVEGVGRVLIETIRVQEREKPYVLQLELARGRLLRLIHKVEDWGPLNDDVYNGVNERIIEARDLLILSLQADKPEDAAAVAEQSLAVSMRASEELALLVSRGANQCRKESPAGAQRFFGCSVSLAPPTDLTKKRLGEGFDFVTLPLVWRDIEPAEQTFNWGILDAWVEALAKSRTPIHASPLLSFREKNVPDWLYLWEHDFDTIRDLAFEHVRRVMNRYGQYINAWTVISGIHENNCFSFSFEQLIELTRMASSLAKQMAPRATTVVEIVTPWGEYYAENQRTIPPLLYADMAMQSGVAFDSFALRFQFGPGGPGTCVRDLFQISAMLDQFVKLGKPLHITAVEVPSQPVPQTTNADAKTYDGGMWRGTWSESLQAQWLENVFEITLGKSLIESVSWHKLADYNGMAVPCGGLLRSDLAPKESFQRLLDMRPMLASGPAEQQ